MKLKKHEDWYMIRVEDERVECARCDVGVLDPHEPYVEKELLDGEGTGRQVLIDRQVYCLDCARVVIPDAIQGHMDAAREAVDAVVYGMFETDQPRAVGKALRAKDMQNILKEHARAIKELRWLGEQVERAVAERAAMIEFVGLPSHDTIWDLAQDPGTDGFEVAVGAVREWYDSMPECSREGCENKAMARARVGSGWDWYCGAHVWSAKKDGGA